MHAWLYAVVIAMTCGAETLYVTSAEVCVYDIYTARHTYTAIAEAKFNRLRRMRSYPSAVK